MQAKRGQITVFIIIGVVLIAGLGLFLYLKSTAVPQEEAVPADIAPIKVYIDQCLKSVAEDAVLTVALQGGYYLAPERSLNFLNIYLPYYSYEGDVSIPTITDIETELSIYIDNALPSCIADADLENRGFNLTFDLISTKTTIAEKNVMFDVDMPIIIRIENEEKRLSKFSASVDTDLKSILSVVYSFMDVQKNYSSGLVISELMVLTSESGTMFDLFTFDDNTEVVSIISNRSMIKNNPLIFGFAFRFSRSAEEGLSLGYFNVQTADVGKLFTLDLQAKGDSLKFQDDTELFDVGPDGVISFTPVPGDEGDYEISIYAEDSGGKKAFTSFDLNIVSS